MKKKKVFLTIPQYANHRGKDQNAVRYAIKNKKIISVKRGPKKEVLIDRDAADQEWVTRDNPREQVITPASPPPAILITPEIMKESESEDSGDDDDISFHSVAKYRAKKEKYEAEMAQIKVEVARGKLVEAKDIEDRWVQVATITRTKVLGIPSKARQRMPELTDLQYSILEMIVRETLEDLASNNVTGSN